MEASFVNGAQPNIPGILQMHKFTDRVTISEVRNMSIQTRSFITGAVTTALISALFVTLFTVMVIQPRDQKFLKHQSDLVTQERLLAVKQEAFGTATRTLANYQIQLIRYYDISLYATMLELRSDLGLRTLGGADLVFIQDAREQTRLYDQSRVELGAFANSIKALYGFQGEIYDISQEILNELNSTPDAKIGISQLQEARARTIVKGQIFDENGKNITHLFAESGTHAKMTELHLRLVDAIAGDINELLNR